MSWSLDHLGPMTRTVRDTALLLQAIAGHDPRDAHTSVATPPNYTRGLEDGVRGLRGGCCAATTSTGPTCTRTSGTAANLAFGVLARQGAEIQDVDAPTLDLAAAAWAPFLAEMFEYHRETVRDRWTSTASRPGCVC